MLNNSFFPVAVATFFSLSLLSGCAASYPEAKTEISLGELTVLPDVLEETSGLFCSASSIVSLNDSGNKPELFHLSYEGKILKTDRLALDNIDWEAITASPSHWYVADVGNNKGGRESLNIYKVDKANLNDITVLTVTYEGNDPSSNMPYAHDFDSEAMVYANGKLLLFSKSWRTGVAKVYEVNESAEPQKLKAFAQIEGLPGVITGVDYDAARNLYVVVGYKSDPFGNFDTFIAQVDTSFVPINIWPLPVYKQVEGVCVDDNGSYWFTEEATGHRKASLTEAKIVQK
ncbi:hypothetical protein Q4561_12030 [Alteromonas sp. 1_MG-2023]|uniref:hypothetical protein n=1 Tax=Alteromonas sp. 1_MG-2023 TaxID=3062669 RepID=UPI0026E17BC6|nr:hypothetical protein [Alteromonas sp. 1_MG-2023]MDO6567790.1 hypothetical protein [Alteromonas sp. 1_MG-2023]